MQATEAETRKEMKMMRTKSLHMLAVLALLAVSAGTALAADAAPQRPPEPLDPRVAKAAIERMLADLRLQDAQAQVSRDETEARMREVRERCGAPCADQEAPPLPVPPKR